MCLLRKKTLVSKQDLCWRGPVGFAGSKLLGIQAACSDWSHFLSQNIHVVLRSLSKVPNHFPSQGCSQTPRKPSNEPQGGTDKEKAGTDRPHRPARGSLPGMTLWLHGVPGCIWERQQALTAASGRKGVSLRLWFVCATSPLFTPQLFSCSPCPSGQKVATQLLTEY